MVVYSFVCYAEKMEDHALDLVCAQCCVNSFQRSYYRYLFSNDCAVVCLFSCKAQIHMVSYFYGYMSSSSA